MKNTSNSSKVENSKEGNKYVPFTEYQKLKNFYLKLKEKYEKIKNDNIKLKSMLDEMCKNIDIFQETKNNIDTLTKSVQEKYLSLNEEFKTYKTQKSLFHIDAFDIEYVSHSNEKIDNLNNELTALNNNYNELNEKYKTLKEEHNKCFLNKLCSTANSTNLVNKNEIRLQSMKTALIENYIYSVNFGYEENNQSDTIKDDGNNDTLCEPVSSLVKFLRKV